MIYAQKVIKMLVDESRGSFKDIIRSSAPATAEIAVALRHLIQELFQDVTEVPRPAEQHADYVVSAGKPDGVFAYICPVKDYVRMGFYYGASLPDPAGLLVGTGKRLRHVKIYALPDVLHPEIRELIIAAYDDRKGELESMGGN